MEMPMLPRWADKVQSECPATFQLLSQPPLGTGGVAVPLSGVCLVPVSPSRDLYLGLRHSLIVGAQVTGRGG